MNWKMIFPLALMLWAFHAKAYVYTQDFQSGYYWKSFPISMGRFVSSASDGALLANATNGAESQWESAVGKNLWDLSPIVIGSGSGNLVRWSTDFANETGFDPQSTLAVTVRYAKGTYLERVVIILNSGIPALKQDFGGLLQKTILHEMGHVIGLDHTSERAIMAATISSLSTLQQDDVAGANAVVSEALYRQATGYVAPVAAGGEQENNASMLSSCGTIDLNSGGKGGGPGSFLLSFFLGVFMIFAGRRVICSVTSKR